MANFVIGPIAVADITLASCALALVKLSVGIVLMVQFPHSLSLPNDPIWYYTIGVDAVIVIVIFHFRVDTTKMSRYFSDIASCADPLCL